MFAFTSYCTLFAGRTYCCVCYRTCYWRCLWSHECGHAWTLSPSLNCSISATLTIVLTWKYPRNYIPRYWHYALGHCVWRKSLFKYQIHTYIKFYTEECVPIPLQWGCPNPRATYAPGHICILRIIKFKHLFRRLGIPPVVIFTRASCESAHNNGYGP